MFKSTKVINENSLNPNTPPKTVTSTSLGVSTDNVVSTSRVPMYIAIGIAAAIIIALLIVIVKSRKGRADKAGITPRNTPPAPKPAK
jgi:hypothetical protein